MKYPGVYAWILLFLVLNMCSVFALVRKSACVKIIFDTDMLTDCDDTAALGILHAYSGGYPFSISGDIRSVPS